MEKILSENPDLNIRVFAVWEPILKTDFSKPMAIVLNRLSDRRVVQFWDKDHVLASRMSQDARPPQPTQQCCFRNGHLWDLVAIYHSSEKWETQMPAATMFNGPVLYVEKEIRQALRSPME